MSPELFKYIRTLTSRDSKTLSQKTLKCIEEIGELAKKVLPYEGASATNHRIVAKEDILEEVADSILCLLSVAYDLGFADDDVSSMMYTKATKWDKLLRHEAPVTFPLPFEIHITVNLESSNTSVAEFREFCSSVDVKPIILDLQNKHGTSVMGDVMTSSKHIGSNTSVLEYANNLAAVFTQHGYSVVRVKIETVPWHPAAPQTSAEQMPRNCYFEAHIPVVLGPNELVSSLAEVIQTECLDVHMSRNVFKTFDDGSSVIMLTYRSATIGNDTFQPRLTEIVQALRDFTIGKVHTEFALYDTKVSHDASWLK